MQVIKSLREICGLHTALPLDFRQNDFKDKEYD